MKQVLYRGIVNELEKQPHLKWCATRQEDNEK